MKAFSILFLIVLLASCAPSGEQKAANTPVPPSQTQTAAPTLTFTLAPTFTPRPTLTPRPTQTPEPVLASIGETVRYSNLDITLLEVVTHSQIVTGGLYYYYSKSGETFIDMTVRVRNEQSLPLHMTMNDIYIVEETGDAWYPNFSGIQTVELDKLFNPMANIKFDETFEYEDVKFEKDTYLRLIFYVKQGQNVLFGIQDSPQFAFPVE